MTETFSAVSPDDDEQLVVLRSDKLIEQATFLKNYKISRPITNLEWNKNHRDLFLCTYGQSESTYNSEYDFDKCPGLVNVMSTQMPDMPEITLKCQSEVTACIFHPFQPSIVIGGTFSGSLVSWDIRTKKKFPVLRSYNNDHPFFVTSVNVIGTQNANNIISISNDGTLCDWGDDIKESVKSFNIQANQNEELAIHSVCFPEEETNKFFFGSEESSIFHAKIHTQQDHIEQRYEGHRGAVLSIDVHPNNIEARNLILSSGSDWRLGLWNGKSPLWMKEMESEVYDARWSPTHPSVFATCNGEGSIDLWDLNKDHDSYRFRKEDKNKKAINKIRWSTDGMRMISGNNQGEIKLWSVDKDFWMPKDEDSTRFDQLINKKGFNN